jgi:hypothetical protein
VGTRIVPPSEAPFEARIQETVPYQLWYVPYFPLDRLGGKLDKDAQQNPWLQGLYEDLKREPRFRNPVIVWNHHPHRGGKQPEWLLRAGSNRVWCAEQLKWTAVPALVSTVPNEVPPGKQMDLIEPREMELFLGDPGKIWANDQGFGLYGVHRPEDMYSEYTESDLPATRIYKRTRIDHIASVVE